MKAGSEEADWAVAAGADVVNSGRCYEDARWLPRGEEGSYRCVAGEAESAVVCGEDGYAVCVPECVYDGIVYEFLAFCDKNR